jgi:hypothetical protein
MLGQAASASACGVHSTVGARLVAGVPVGAVLQQDDHAVQVALLSGTVQWRLPVSLDSLNVRAVLQQQPHAQ